MGRSVALSFLVAILVLGSTSSALAATGWGNAVVSVVFSGEAVNEHLVIDDNVGTGSSRSGTSGQYRFDFTSSVEVSGWRLWSDGDTAHSKFDNVVLEVCTSSAYTSCSSVSGGSMAVAGTSVGWYEKTFTAVSGQYWRLVITENTWLLMEVEFLTCDSGCATPTPTVTFTPTPTLSPTPTTTPSPTSTMVPPTATSTATPVPPTATPPASGEYFDFSVRSSYPTRWLVCSYPTGAGSAWPIEGPLCRFLDWIHGEGRSTTFGWSVSVEGGEGFRDVLTYIVPPSISYAGDPMVVEAMDWSCISFLRMNPVVSDAEHTVLVQLQSNNVGVSVDFLGTTSGFADSYGDVGFRAVFSDPSGLWYSGSTLVTGFPGVHSRVTSSVVGKSAAVNYTCSVVEAVGMVDDPYVTPGPTELPTATAGPVTPTATPELTATPGSPTSTPTRVIEWGTPWPTPDGWSSGDVTTPVPWDGGSGLSTPVPWDGGSGLSTPVDWDVVGGLPTKVAWVGGDLTPVPAYEAAPDLVPEPTRSFDIGISSPDTNCLFEFDGIGPFGGTPIVGIPIPLLSMPEFAVCTEEYEFEFEFLGWDLGALMSVVVVALGFGLLWSIIKR